MQGWMRKTALACLPALLTACQSSPTELYVLSAQPAPSGDARSGARLVEADARGAAHFGDSRRLTGTVGVAVAVPDYLDRLDIVQRAGDYELKPSYNAQWAESLSIDATRVVGEDLEALLPSANVVMLPTRTRPAIDYEVDITLVRFESDAGSSRVAGEWTIAASDGHPLATGHFRRSEPIAQSGFREMAAAMSRNLAAVSTDVANALDRLAPPVQNTQSTHGRATVSGSLPHRPTQARAPDGPATVDSHR